MNRSKFRSTLRTDYQALEPKLLLASLPEFSTDPGLYQIYSNYGRTGQVDLVNQSFDTAPFNAGTKVNAAGYRAADNFAYGIMTGSYDLVRIGSNGQIENLGGVTGLPQEGSFYVGDFADDGLLYVRGSQDRQILLGIDVDLGEVTSTISASQSLDSIYDIAFNNTDQKFYASARGPENYLISIDLQGNVATIGNNGLSRITFGAMYADADGSVFGGSNQDGGIYRFDTQTGEAFLVGEGPTSGTNDGFANATIVQEIPPLAFDDFFETDGVQSTEGNLFDDNTFGNDIDGNGDELQVTAINGDPALVGQVIVLDTGSKILVESDGSFQYKPSVSFQNLTVNQQIKEDFTYEIADPSGFTSTATTEIKVVGVQESDEFEGIRVTGFEAFGGKNYVRLENVGDINGDGFDDGMASMWTANNGRGMTALVYGDSSGFTADFNINNLRTVNSGDGSEGTLFHGANNNDLSGYRFAGLGDVNGDGIDDIAISAKDADPNGTINAGETYVVFGSTNGFGAEFDLGQIKSSGGGDGSEGFVLEGISNHDLSGMAVAGVGDFNGDGLNDVAVSSKFADVDGRINTGQVYVVYGSSSGFDANISLADITADGGNDGSLGVVFNGMRKHDLAGSEVSAGDVNGDGLGDLVITARFGDSYGLMYDVGHSYVIYGSQSWQTAEFELVSLHTDSSASSTGIVIHGSRRFKQTGSFVKIVGDLNNDGKDDLVVGLNDCNSLETHVLDGGSSTLDTDLELVELDNSATILLDNFDQPEDIYDDRDWDRFTFNVTLHSDVGSQVTIWGDPHVVIKMDGLTRRFDIGLGPQTIELKGGTTLTWDTAEPDWVRYPKGPPLTFFNIDSPGVEFDHDVDLLDEQNFIDAETGLTEAQLREFARVLYDMKIT